MLCERFSFELIISQPISFLNFKTQLSVFEHWLECLNLSERDWKQRKVKRIYGIGHDGLVSIVTEVWARRPKYRSSIPDKVK